MRRESYTHYSNCLSRDMNMMIYGGGDDAWPVIVFPSQDGMCHDYENFGMIDALSDFIEAGEIELFCVDTVDRESWSDKEGDKSHRAWMQEMYYCYIVNEVLPVVQEISGSSRPPLVTGCSMGAMHAAITFFRRPDIFGGMIGLSGVYDTNYFFDGWMNETLYDNAPLAFLKNMPLDHPYIRLYNKRAIAVCVGRGAWEDDGIRSAYRLDDILRSKGVSAWVDFWGYDVNHDWDWWRKQIRYFMPYALADMKLHESGVI
ncbi:MAG: esterase family protein [Selenomonadaceae bacterium]